MSEAGQAAADFMQQGKVFDSASEWLDTHVPLAGDTDGDGVDDEFDGSLTILKNGQTRTKMVWKTILMTTLMGMAYRMKKS